MLDPLRQRGRKLVTRVQGCVSRTEIRAEDVEGGVSRKYWYWFPGLTGFKNGSQVSTVRWIMRASPVALATLRCFGGADATKKPVAVQAGS
jgi:hypothetical protein